jgi:hypothetical protein
LHTLFYLMRKIPRDGKHNGNTADIHR